MTHAKPEEALDVVDRLSAHPISRSKIQIGSDLFLAPLRGTRDFMQQTDGDMTHWPTG